jgi:hypothetical protein
VNVLMRSIGCIVGVVGVPAAALASRTSPVALSEQWVVGQATSPRPPAQPSLVEGRTGHVVITASPPGYEPGRTTTVRSFRQIQPTPTAPHGPMTNAVFAPPGGWKWTGAAWAMAGPGRH